MAADSQTEEVHWSYVLTYSIHQNILALEVIQIMFCHDGVGTIINLSKVNIIPCMYCYSPFSWTACT